jgi:hypothetical protein
VRCRDSETGKRVQISMCDRKNHIRVCSSMLGVSHVRNNNLNSQRSMAARRWPAHIRRVNQKQPAKIALLTFWCQSCQASSCVKLTVLTWFFCRQQDAGQPSQHDGSWACTFPGTADPAAAGAVVLHAVEHQTTECWPKSCRTISPSCSSTAQAGVRHVSERVVKASLALCLKASGSSSSSSIRQRQQ